MPPHAPATAYPPHAPQIPSTGTKIKRSARAPMLLWPLVPGLGAPRLTTHDHECCRRNMRRQPWLLIYVSRAGWMGRSGGRPCRGYVATGCRHLRPEARMAALSAVPRQGPGPRAPRPTNPKPPPISKATNPKAALSPRAFLSAKPQSPKSSPQPRSQARGAPRRPPRAYLCATNAQTINWIW